MQPYFRAAFLLALLFFAGCASYSSKIKGPRRLLEAGQYDTAIAELQELAKKKDNDQLLYLMDLGIAYHRAGRYKQAIDAFHEADKLAEISDYTSLTKEAASVLLSDEVKPYPGEDFEKILINGYLAMDYALLGQWEDALVESRRVNHKLDLMISEGKLPYEHNAFAKYVAGAMFEAQGEPNRAFVDYRQLYKWKGGMPYLDEALLNLASKLGFSQELQDFRKKMPNVKDYRVGKNEGEVILLVEQGRAPIKVPHPNFRLLPKFRRRFSLSRFVTLRDESKKHKAESVPYFDIENTAIKELDHRVGLIAAKKIGGIVVKQIVADQVAKQTKSKVLGALTSLVLHATDSADLRSWTTLPASLQIARLRLPKGKHTLVVDVHQVSGGVAENVKVWKNIDIKPGRIAFLTYRTDR